MAKKRTFVLDGERYQFCGRKKKKKHHRGCGLLVMVGSKCPCDRLSPRMYKNESWMIDDGLELRIETLDAKQRAANEAAFDVLAANTASAGEKTG